MSVDPDPVRDDASARDSVIARAERARHRAEARLAGSIDDLFLETDARLDERTRLRIAQVLQGIVGAIEADIRHHAARLLAGHGATASADLMLAPRGAGRDAMERLGRAGLLRDPDLMDELIARVRQDLIGEMLRIAEAEPGATSLLVRLASVPDSIVASAANALLAVESRRRAAMEAGIVIGSELPAELHHRLVWWIAATIRTGFDSAARQVDRTIDRAIGEAALRSIGAHDEGDRPEALAMRLALAIEARPNELAAILTEAIGDRRLTLFIALLAHAIGVDFDQARMITLEPDGDRLWLALRAIDFDRRTIARIGLALAEADSRRDVEAFADSLDEIVGVSVDDARATLVPLAQHRDFRAAMRALTRSDRR